MIARCSGLAPGAARTLTDGVRGRVAIAVTGGAWLDLGTGWVLVASHRAPLGPLTVRLDAEPPDLRPDDRASVGDGVLTAGPLAVVLEGAVVGPSPSPGARLDGWRTALRAAAGAVRAPSAALSPGIAAVAAGCPDEAAARLTGLGPGLTPEGDDVLAGAAAWFHAEGDLAAAHALTARPAATTALSAALLACAARGELVDVAMATLAAIRAGRAAAAAALAGTLGTWGATSGDALVTGMAAAARTAA